MLNKNRVLEEKQQMDLVFFKQYFINSTIKQGRKLYAENMVHDMLWIFKRFLKCDPYLILHRGLINLMPFMGLISIKLGASTYSIPVSISVHRQRFQAVKGVVKSIKSSKTNLTSIALAEVLYGAYCGEGPAMDKKKALYQSGVDNAPYVRFLLK